MTIRQTPHDRDDLGKMPQNIDFSKFMVNDSFSVPATDTTPGGGAPDTEMRISKKQLIGIDSRLGERDRGILTAVRAYRYLMTGQVGRLLFTDAANPTAGLRAASRNLKKLNGLGLVDHLSRRIGGVRAGSSSLVWHITHAGERLLGLHSQRAYPVRRHFEPSAYFLAHTLAVAETAIRMTEICRGHALEVSALQLEPECWRAYSDIGATVSLKPDLYIMTVNDEYEDRYFIEVDLGTESPAKIIEKCERYHRYYSTGLEQDESGVFPLTVWIVPDTARKERLIAHIRKAFDKRPLLFAVITGEELEHIILEGGDRGMLC